MEGSTILGAESDMPELVGGRARDVLEALRTLRGVVEDCDPGMYLETVHGMLMDGQRVLQGSAERSREGSGDVQGCRERVSAALPFLTVSQPRRRTIALVDGGESSCADHAQ